MDMSGKKTAVFGIYSSLPSADNATDTFVRSGFPSADISALLPDNLGGKEIGTQKATKAPEGAATGAGSGAVLGSALGLLAGIGALAIPVLVRLLQPDRSWRLSREWEWEEPWVGLRAL